MIMNDDRIYQSLDRIEDKLDKAIDRVSALEIWKATINAKIAVVVGVISLVFTAIWEVLKDRIMKGN